MPRFRYTAAEETGDWVRGEEDAPSGASLLESLARRGLAVVSIEESTGSGGGLAERLRAVLKSPAARRLTFVRELASLTAAGLNTEEALAILADMPEEPDLAELAQAIRNKLRRGTTFAKSLEIDTQIFPDHMRALVAAGEASGTLPTVLTRLAEDLARQSALSAQITSALIYPVILFSVLAGVLAIIFLYVVPAFDAVFAGYERELPISTRALLSISRALTGHGVVVLLGACGIGYLAYRVLSREGTQSALARIWIRPNFAFGLGLKLASAQFCRVLSLLLANGVPLALALRLAAPTLGSSALTDSVEAAAGRVREGATLASALRKEALLSPSVLRVTAIGEETGRLAPLLHELAVKLEHDTNATLNRMVAFLVPMLTLLMGALVALVVGAILSGIMSLQRQML